VIADVFRTAKGAGGTAEGKEPTQRIVFQVTDVKDPAFDPKSSEAKGIEDTLRRAIADDLFVQYIGQLQAELGTTINQSAFNQAIGGGNAPD
jgi:peptidyl-prolyl cis-trans isomerase D